MPQFKEEGKVQPRDDAKATLKGVPTGEFVGYLLVSAACVGLWGYAAVGVARGTVHVMPGIAYVLSFLCGFGPVIAACAIIILQRGVPALLEPFNQKPLHQSLVHILIGSFFCCFSVSMPAYLSVIS
jgi:hypothetical protein